MRFSKGFPFVKFNKAGSTNAAGDRTTQDTACEAPVGVGLCNDDTQSENIDLTRYGLKVLVSQRPEKEACFDIIAIHGLNGHYETTWTDRTTGANWLRNPAFIATDIPNARVQSFGYNSISYFSRSNANVEDFASELLASIKSSRGSKIERQRPIVFICHSLGGIVFKQALIRAYEQDNHYRNIIEHIKGVAFFGTPHRGSDLASWDHIGTSLMRAMALGYSTNPRLSKDLSIDSEILRRISSSFVHRAKSLKIRSFYETELMKGLNCRVVEKDSSVLNIPNEIAIATPANHSSIAKFPSRNDSRYKVACSGILELFDESIEGEDLEESELSEGDQMCLRALNSDYESHLSQIDDPVPGTCNWIVEHSQWKKWEAASNSSLLWITADAGCGKSVIAKSLINHHQSRSRYSPSNVCYFFFRDGFELQDNAQSALSAILHQIYCHQPALIKYARSKFTTLSPHTFKQFPYLQTVFLSTVDDDSLEDTLCILDGIDECEPKSRDLFIKLLASYFTNPTDGSPRIHAALKIVILSRPSNAIQGRFPLSEKKDTGGNVENILPGKRTIFRLFAEEESVAISKDVNLFIRARIEEFGLKSELSAEVLAQVESKLVNGADFTFLWVSLVVKLLEEAELDGISREKLDVILHTTDLNEIYNSLLSGKEHDLKTRKVLYVMLAAARPMTLAEMCVALEVHQDYMPQPEQSKKDEGFWGSNNISMNDTHYDFPSQSFGKVLNLTLLSKKLHKPFGNHLRKLCGHFLRIRGNKIYFVHQTARKFLLDTKLTPRNTLGYYLRPFGWKIERPSLAELEFLRKHKHLPRCNYDMWKHSMRLDVAIRYLLQVCVDYIGIFESLGQAYYGKNTQNIASRYIESRKDDPAWALLTYSSVHWVEHYRIFRKDLRNYFDYLFDRGREGMAFEIWMGKYLASLPSEEERARERPNTETGIPISPEKEPEASSNGKFIKSLTGREERLQQILDFFSLSGIDTEMYDEEFIEGDQYWKETKNDGIGTQFNVTEGVDSRSDLIIPDRVQYLRRLHRNQVQEKIRESLDPMSAGSGNPGSVSSFYTELKKNRERTQGPRIRKADFYSQPTESKTVNDHYGLIGGTKLDQNAIIESKGDDVIWDEGLFLRS